MLGYIIYHVIQQRRHSLSIATTAAAMWFHEGRRIKIVIQKLKPDDVEELNKYTKEIVDNL